MHLNKVIGVNQMLHLILIRYSVIVLYLYTIVFQNNDYCYFYQQILHGRNDEDYKLACLVQEEYDEEMAGIIQTQEGKGQSYYANPRQNCMFSIKLISELT